MNSAIPEYDYSISYGAKETIKVVESRKEECQAITEVRERHRKAGAAPQRVRLCGTMSDLHVCTRREPCALVFNVDVRTTDTQVLHKCGCGVQNGSVTVIHCHDHRPLTMQCACAVL